MIKYFLYCMGAIAAVMFLPQVVWMGLGVLFAWIFFMKALRYGKKR